MMPVFSTDWTRRAVFQRARVQNLLQGKLYKDKSHPIFNFLFSYFHFKPPILLQYSPGMNIPIEFDAESHKYLCPRTQSISNGLITYDPKRDDFTDRQRDSLNTTLKLLQRSFNKHPNFHCFGLHEWAMLYTNSKFNTNPEVPHRRQALPLRISQHELNRIVEDNNLNCTHFDAFRFFADSAKPFNRTSPIPSRINQPDQDQAGCVHVTMDLFKYGIYKIYE